ncbi:isopentenyl transferase family protein [Ensifer aridi]|uniref:isopentenyl transferase family protein n=1 Tax=Ensifer aridi TaxID=1708715 RepID=UPI000A10BC81|nr:isopentenyl transferase family protein [Ensifer aridi]
MLIYLIYGPTCSGKTDLGVQIARETGWPVIALDRVQCCPQVATGSGRPLEAELQSTQRIYLDSRPLAEGVIETEAAHLQLISEVEDRKSSPGLILEGGSISLLNCMANSSYWNAGFRWQVSRLRLTTPDVFLSRARRRVAEMFAIRDERPSLLEELADLWNQNAVRPILEDIAGYRCAIRFAKEHNVAISELLHLDPLRQQALIAAIADEYLEYARWQERDFPDWREDDRSSGGFTLAACGEVNLVNQRDV